MKSKRARTTINHAYTESRVILKQYLCQNFTNTRELLDLYGIQGNPVAHLTLNNLQILVSHNCVIKFFLFSLSSSDFFPFYFYRGV